MPTPTTVSLTRTIAGRPVPASGRYDIDGEHSSVEFVVRHLMITKVRGRFGELSGAITIGEQPEDSHVEIDIAAAGIDTGHEDRDRHLRSADFFDTDQYPNLSFRSTSVRAVDSGDWEVAGELVIRGVSRAVSLEIAFGGANRSPAGDERIGFTAQTEVDREDWGLTWNQPLESGGVLLGRRVRIELEVQASRIPGQ